MSKEWRCFQCDELFTDEVAARDHFGQSVLLSPLCCDHSLATYRQVLRQFRESEVLAQTLYRQKVELEKQVEHLKAELSAIPLT